MSGGSIWTNNGNIINGDQYTYTNKKNLVSIYSSSSKNITITGGNISGGTDGIETVGSGEISIDKVKIANVYRGIYKHGTGKIEIKGGTISGFNPINIQVEDLQDVQNMEITGSTNISANHVYENGAVGNTISNSKNSKILIDLNENNSISGINGIYNDGTIEIKNGKIVVETPEVYKSKKLYGEHNETELYGIKNNQGGIVTIGQIDNQANTNNPFISGEYGIINDGTLNFYDGRIEGDIDKSVNGKSIQNKEIGFRVVRYRNGENANIEVSDGKEITILEEGSAVEVIHQGQETGTGYDYIEQALAISQNNDTIKLLADISINESEYSFAIDNNITLDLAGNKMAVQKDNTITNNGELEIIDTSLSKTGKIIIRKQNSENSNLNQNAIATLINNNGTLKLSSGRIEINDDRNMNEENRSIIKNKGNVVLDGMIINCKSNALTIINNIEAGTFTMNSGEINFDLYKLGTFINNDGIGNINLNGGKIKSTNYYVGYGATLKYYVIKNNSNANIQISNIEIDGGIYGIYNKAGNITMTGGIIQNIVYGIENLEGTVSISGGKISAKANAIFNNSGTININGDAEIITNDGRYGESIYEGDIRDVTIYNGKGALNINGENVKIKSETNTAIQGGTLENNDSDDNIQQQGQIHIISGIVEGYNYGVHNLDNNVTLGSEDNLQSGISIISENGFGISNQKDGNLNYYSGIIKGKNSEEYGSIVGSINTIKQNNNINITVENGETKEVATLVTKSDIAQIGERKFDNLKDAIDECNANDTVTILNNFAITGNESIQIPQGKTITIDLNGKTITSFVKNNLLINNGNLTITDNITNSKINLRKDGLITNNGTLEIRNIQIVQYAEGSLIYGINPIIDNLGILTLNNETISTHKRYIKAISNKGTVNIQSGTINLLGQYYNTAIENLGNGVVNITGGKIELKTGYMSLDYNKYEGQELGTSVVVWNYNNNGDYICDNYFTDNYMRKTYNYVIEDLSNGTINITGGEIIDSKVYLKNGSTAKLIIDGEAAYVAKIELENIKQNDENNISKIISGKVGHIKLTNSNLKIEGGEIGECRYSYPTYEHFDEDGILVFGNSQLEITGGKIHSKDSNAIELNDISSHINKLYNISENESDLKNPTVVVTSGEIISEKKSGIYSNAENATVTIGKDDNSVSTTSPSITAKGYGVYINEFNFNDGVINGNITPKNGDANIPDGFSIYAQNDAKTISLIINGTFPNAVMLNGSYYKSIKEAIENIGSSSEATIVLKGNAIIEEPIIIPEGKTVTIKRNNFTIENQDNISGNVIYED